MGCRSISGWARTRRKVMEDRLLHVFRNTPFGRETFLQSLYFCKTLGVVPHVYIPQSTQFLLYFDHDAVQVDLDGTYLTSPETASAHVETMASQSGAKCAWVVPKNFTASQLPDIPTNFNYMCCPRSISDLSAKIISVPRCAGSSSPRHFRFCLPAWSSNPGIASPCSTAAPRMPTKPCGGGSTCTGYLDIRWICLHIQRITTRTTSNSN